MERRGDRHVAQRPGPPGDDQALSQRTRFGSLDATDSNMGVLTPLGLCRYFAGGANIRSRNEVWTPLSRPPIGHEDRGSLRV